VRPLVRDYECISCGARREERGFPSTGFVCDKCGCLMQYVMTLGTVQAATDALWPMIHPHLGHKPVEVKGWGHYKQLLKERGLRNSLGS
jgi:hypothetical protein